MSKPPTLLKRQKTQNISWTNRNTLWGISKWGPFNYSGAYWVRLHFPHYLFNSVISPTPANTPQLQAYTAPYRCLQKTHKHILGHYYSTSINKKLLLRHYNHQCSSMTYAHFFQVLTNETFKNREKVLSENHRWTKPWVRIGSNSLSSPFLFIAFLHVLFFFPSLLWLYTALPSASKLHLHFTVSMRITI